MWQPVRRFRPDASVRPGGVYKFETCSAYFRTYHNVTADALTRKAKAEVAELLKAKKLTPVDLEQAWTDHLSRDWIRRAFTWMGPGRELAQAGPAAS